MSILRAIITTPIVDGPDPETGTCGTGCGVAVGALAITRVGVAVARIVETGVLVKALVGNFCRFSRGRIGHRPLSYTSIVCIVK
jgi:hypothetical protein